MKKFVSYILLILSVLCIAFMVACNENKKESTKEPSFFDDDSGWTDFY